MLKLYNVYETPLAPLLDKLGYKDMERCMFLGFTDGEKGFSKNVAKNIHRIAHRLGDMPMTGYMTRSCEKGRFNDLTVGFCGDLKFGRTVHSLISALSRYTGIKIVLISPEELKLPSYVKNEALKKNNIPYEQTTDLEAVMPELDILYMPRVQRERFFSEEDYIRLKDSYILTPEKLRNAKKDLCILHPLPRVNEISVAVDDDPRACYFKQVRNGRFIRMALILKLLGIE